MAAVYRARMDVPPGGGGQRACERGGWGMVRKKVRERATAQLANLRIYPLQSTAL